MRSRAYGYGDGLAQITKTKFRHLRKQNRVISRSELLTFPEAHNIIEPHPDSIGA